MAQRLWLKLAGGIAAFGRLTARLGGLRERPRGSVRLQPEQEWPDHAVPVNCRAIADSER